MKIQSLALLSGLRIWCPELWCRRGSDVALLWCRQAATAPVRPLAWELLYAAGAALKTKKKEKKKSTPPLEDGPWVGPVLPALASPGQGLLRSVGWWWPQNHVCVLRDGDAL